MPRRILEGTVVSNKMDKTITVLVERRTMHPVYKKYLKRSAKYAVHDESNVAQEGQKVQIIECAPISKRKSWVLLVDGKEQGPVEVKGQPKAAPKREKAPKAEEKAPAKKLAAKKAAAKKKA